MQDIKAQKGIRNTWICESQIKVNDITYKITTMKRYGGVSCVAVGWEMIDNSLRSKRDSETIFLFVPNKSTRATARNIELAHSIGLSEFNKLKESNKLQAQAIAA